MSYLTLTERIEQRVHWIAGRVLPARRAQRLERRSNRDRLDGQLAKIAAESPHRFDGTVLIDASWDNPNHWVRLTLLRAALGLHKANEVGYLGAYRHDEMRRSLETLGVDRIISFDTHPADDGMVAAQVKELLSRTKRPDDILDWKLPGDYPPGLLYDAILKRQRKAQVDPNDPRFPELVTFGLRCLNVAERLLSQDDVRLVVISAVNNFRNGPLAWLAASRGIPSVAIYGNFGVPRFYKVTSPEHVWGKMDRPTPEQIDALTPERAEALGRVGRECLNARFSGRTADLGAVRAYRERSQRASSQGIRDKFGWRDDKPIIAVYAANWYDFPHNNGLRHFRDYADWIFSTAAFAQTHSDVNWIFKPHPNEVRYPGVTLRQAIPDLECAHVRFAVDGWNNASVVQSVDGVVALHGMVSVEALALGTPVLLADRGCYDCGSAIRSHSREDYFDNLGRAWWKEIDLVEARRRAEIFAGWFYGYPERQPEFLLSEDTEQDAGYDSLLDLLQGARPAIWREIGLVREWFESDHRLYHTAKMLDAAGFTHTKIAKRAG